MDIAGILKDALGDKMTSELGVSGDQVDGIVKTIAGTAKKQGGAGSLVSGLSGMFSGKSSNPLEKMGSQVVADLIEKAGLSKSMAQQVADMAVPVVLKALKDQAGEGGISGMLGKFK